jgi:ATP-binding protein involved in chromosome partitioning
MFEKVGVPISGLVQNMSLFQCPHCGGATHVFGGGADESAGGGADSGVRRLCEKHGIDVLADIPLHPRIGGDGQSGKPTVVAEPGSERAELFLQLARHVGERIGLPSM